MIVILPNLATSIETESVAFCPGSRTDTVPTPTKPAELAETAPVALFTANGASGLTAYTMRESDSKPLFTVKPK